MYSRGEATTNYSKNRKSVVIKLINHELL